jgi:DNA binding protein with HTH domain
MTIATDLIHAAKSRGLDDPIWLKPSAINHLNKTSFQDTQHKQYIAECEALRNAIGSRKITVKELSDALGLTPKTIYKRLQLLLSEGKIIKAVSKPPFKYYQNPDYRSE